MGDLRTAVVTGGAGFIGSHLVDRLAGAGATRVIVVDSFFLGRDENLERARQVLGSGLRVLREDASDPDVMQAVCEAEEPDILFNLATKPLLYSFFNPRGACSVNLDLALTAAELLRRGAVGQLIQVSSSEVYGTARTVPMTEEHPLLAETTYAAGKAAADLALQSYARMWKLPVTIVRPFNNYGPRQNTEDFAAIIPRTIRRIRSGEAPILEGDGLQTRDFLFVEDTADAIIRMVDAAAEPGTVVNVASGRETTILAILEQLVELLGWKGEIERRPPRVADVRRHLADVTLGESLIGRLSTTSFDDGMQRTVDWYRTREIA